MAKITWTFKNEEGTNLNRYIATNVSTGEKITFDLLRGGNISVVGTPLNAENLNALITSINACYDLISSSEKDTTYTLSKNGNAIRLTSSSGAINDVTLAKEDVGLSKVDNTSDMDKPISTAQQNALNNKVPITRKINNYSLNADVTLSKSDVGLPNVDNTSDMDKPVSNATQQELDLKANKSDVYTKSETYTKTETDTRIDEKLDEKQTTECNCSHEVEITGFGEEDCNLVIDDQDVVITKIQGQTRRKSLNLLKINDVIETTTNGITYSIKDGVITLNGTSTSDINIDLGTYTLSTDSYGFNVFLNITDKSLFTINCFRDGYWDNIIQYNLQNNPNGWISSGYSTYRFLLNITSGKTVNNLVLKVIMSLGNTIPTYFEPYDNTLVNSKCDFVSTGRNLCNGILEFSNTYLYVIRGCRLKPNTTYTISSNLVLGGNFNVTVAKNEWDESIKLTSDYVNFPTTFTTPSTLEVGDDWIIALRGTFTNSNNGNVMLNYGDTALPYEPYIEDTMQCGLELGQWDYHDNVNHITHRQTANVDLGTLEWKATSTSNVYETHSLKYYVSYKGVTSSYSNETSWVSAGNLGNKKILLRSDVVLIRDDTYTDLTTFKNAMQGVMLYYETETETTEENILPSGYKVWYKGMQIQKTETIPYILTKQYAISLASQVLNNVSIDRSQQKQIDELKENKLNASDLGGFKFINENGTNKMYTGNDSAMSLISNYDEETSTEGTIVGNIDGETLIRGIAQRPTYTNGFTTSGIALSTDLDAITKRLDELGFKQGVVYYDGTAVDNTLATIKKQGKIAILNAIAPALGVSTISVPTEFKPKEETTIMCMASSTLGITIANTISIKTDGTITTPSNFVEIVNAAWEIA